MREAFAKSFAHFFQQKYLRNSEIVVFEILTKRQLTAALVSNNRAQIY